MTVALFLLGYAGLLATAGTAALRRARWTRRALIAGERPLSHVRVLLGLAAAALVLSAPVAAIVAAVPAASAKGCCTTAQQVPGGR